MDGGEHHAGQVLEVDLVNDAGVRRYHGEIAKGGLAPAQESVALVVARKFDLVVARQGLRVAVFIHLHRMVDDQFRRQERIDAGRIAARALGSGAHGSQIHDRGHAGEILHDHPCWHERDLACRLGLRLPARHRLDLLAGDRCAVLAPQQVLEKNLQREWQPLDRQPSGLHCGQAEDLKTAVADPQRGARAE